MLANNGKFISGIVIGGILTFMLFVAIESPFFGGLHDTQPHGNTNKTDEHKPIYWVAPMDSDYRRDKPGKSPMGMDLVPVYATNQQEQASLGGVEISAAIINNLGVKTTPVIEHRFNQALHSFGYLAYNQNNFFHIHPRVSGWIEKLYVKATGDSVVKGQALYDIYSPELVNAQEELLLAIKQKNSRLMLAAEQRLLALEFPQSAINALQKSRQVQHTLNVKAPYAGVIENLAIKEGFFVKPDTKIMAISDLSSLWLEGHVLAGSSQHVKLGANVTMTLDYFPNKRWQGVIEHIYPTLDKTTRALRVRAEISNLDLLLKPNMYANIKIENRDESIRLAVPNEALIRLEHENRVVQQGENGLFKSVRVSTGKRDSRFVEVISGLVLGDTVVTSAQFLLDSESSKKSDFIRMGAQVQATEMSVKQPYSQASVVGEINSIDVAQRQLNISRGPIAKWQRPATTMDFILAPALDIHGLHTGDNIQFTFEVRENTFVIIDYNEVNSTVEIGQELP